MVGRWRVRLAITAVDDTICHDILHVAATTPDTMIDMVKRSLHAANAAVWTEARRVQELRGMGTTCVATLLLETTLIVGNVGDSRCYVLRSGNLIQLSRDHSLLQTHKSRRSTSSDGRTRFAQVMTRAIGFASTVEPEADAYSLQEGDALLLCTDGLTNLLDDAAIATILRASITPQDASDRLVAAAIAQGGDDNITVIVVHYGPFVPDVSLPAEGLQSKDASASPDSGVQTQADSWWKRIGQRLRGSPRQSS